MAVVQSTYATGYAEGFPGMVANGETSNRISRTVEDSAGIAFGVPVFRGSGEHGVTATVSATAANFVGITMMDKTQTTFPAADEPDAYPEDSIAAIMTYGVIWVTAGAAVVAGAQVYVGDGDPLTSGAYDDSATGNVILTGWFFEDSGADGDLVRIARR